MTDLMWPLDAVPPEQVVRLAVEDVEREHTKAEAQLALLDSDPSIIPPQKQDDVLRESLNYKLYDMAWTILRFGI